MALTSGSDGNLTNIIIPPEAIVVLAKTIGFIPFAPSKKLQTKCDAHNAMAKLCRATKSY